MRGRWRLRPLRCARRWREAFGSTPAPVAHGGHLLEQWQRLRDRHLFWPGVTLTEVERPSVDRKQYEDMVKQQSLPREVRIEDHARVMLFLCSEESSFVTGQSIQCEGGRSFL